VLRLNQQQPGGAADEEAEDSVWVPDGGREPADYSGEEEDEEEITSPVPAPASPSKSPAKPPSAVKNGKSPSASGKRAREDEEDGDDKHEGKKVKGQ